MVFNMKSVTELCTNSQFGAVLGIIIAYAVARCVYLLRFHPLSRFPGPKLAAISNVWYGYAWISGRYPWAMQQAFEKYGDIVRVAPNELVFLTPEAYTDIYTGSLNGRPAFVKSNLLDLGDKYEGLASERDIDKHRAGRKQLAPAFSPRALKQYQPTIHEHVDELIGKFEDLADTKDGLEISAWFERATCDLGGSIAMTHRFENVRKGENHAMLETLLRTGHWATLRIVLRRFPLLYPLVYLLLPPKTALAYVSAHNSIKRAIQERMNNRAKHTHLDYMSQYFKHEDEIPPDAYLLSQAEHLVLDHFESSSVLTAGFYFLMTNDLAMKRLQRELRGKFQSLNDIDVEVLQELPWLNATIEEILRLHTNVPYGLPRISPGYTIDKEFIAKGCVVSTCAYATTHSPKYFNKPYEFRPERWLPREDPQYDPVFDTDQKSAFRPFSVGSRNCLGQSMAYLVLRIVFAKLVWKFDWDMVNRNGVDWDRDLRLYMMWQKPQVRVRLTSYTSQSIESGV